MPSLILAALPKTSISSASASSIMSPSPSLLPFTVPIPMSTPLPMSYINPSHFPLPRPTTCLLARPRLTGNPNLSTPWHRPSLRPPPSQSEIHVASTNKSSVIGLPSSDAFVKPKVLPAICIIPSTNQQAPPISGTQVISHKLTSPTNPLTNLDSSIRFQARSSTPSTWVQPNRFSADTTI